MKVFFDTNVLVSAMATRGICTDILNATLAEHQLMAGATVLGELRTALRDKLRLPAAAINDVESFLRDHATIVTATCGPNRFGLDAGDHRVLAEAMACRADALVTGDGDLLAVAPRAPVRIVTPRGFWELLRAG